MSLKPLYTSVIIILLAAFVSNCATAQNEQSSHLSTKSTDEADSSEPLWSSDTSDIEGTWTFEHLGRHMFMIITASGKVTGLVIIESLIDGTKECEDAGRSDTDDIRHDGNGQYRFFKNGKFVEDAYLQRTEKELLFVASPNGSVAFSKDLVQTIYPNVDFPNCLQ